MKLTLVGRPTHVEVRGQVAVMLMQGTQAPPLAKGLPVPTPAPKNRQPTLNDRISPRPPRASSFCSCRGGRAIWRHSIPNPG